MEMEKVEGRIKFLAAEFITLKTLRISSEGHLLILLEDGRCIFMKRNKSAKDYNSLYTTQ